MSTDFFSKTPTGSHLLREAFFVASIAVVLYLSFLSINYDSNGIVAAKAIEAGDWACLNHMLYEVIGIVAVKIAGLFHRSEPALPLLMGIAAVSGALALGATYLAARRMGADRLQGFVATAWLGSTWAFWKWSTEVAYIMTAAAFAAAALALSWHRSFPGRSIAIGVLAAFSILAWQANIFLIPAILIGSWDPSVLRKSRIRFNLVTCLALALTLAVAYSLTLRQLGCRDIAGAVKLITSYGGGNSPIWGHWGSERIGILADTWIRSMIGGTSLHLHWFLSRPVRFNTVFPRLAPIAIAIFLAIPLWFLTRQGKDRAILCSLVGIASYVPFAVWWDPWETKWLVIPNIFLALLCAKLWSRIPPGSAAFRCLAPIAVAILGISNLSIYAVPAHTKLSDDYKAGKCVAEHLGPKDLYLATDWAFGDYISYKYRLTSIDVISTAANYRSNKDEAFRKIREEIRRVYAGGKIYSLDPGAPESGRFKMLEDFTGITPDDLGTQLPGRPAFRCYDWSIRELELPALEVGSR